MEIILICSAIVSYLLGGVNGAIILSSIFFHEDIRTKGSGNPGFTNFKRVYGNRPISWCVILIDVGKTALCVFLTALLMSNYYDMWQFGAAFSGLFCMIGHCFPVWYKFKGGKAFMAGFATIWFVDWRMALCAVAIFFLVLATTKIMSVSSCLASLTCPIALWFWGFESIWCWLLCLLSAILVILRHRSNFIKLIHGEESKFSLHDTKKDK